MIGNSATATSIETQASILKLDWPKRFPKKLELKISAKTSFRFIGLGSSLHVALWAAETARQLGICATATSSFDVLSGDIEPSNKEFTVVVSHRGNRGLTKSVLQKLKNKQHLLICAEGSETGGHPTLFTSEQEKSNAHTMSVMGSMCACLEVIRRALPKSFTTKTEAELTNLAALFKKVGANPDKFLTGSESALSQQTTHLISHGTLHPIALEIALKIREILHKPVVVYQTEEFLHGPVAAVNQGERVILLTPLAQNVFVSERILKIKTALSKLGIKPISPESNAAPFSEIKKINQQFHPFIFLLWGQLLCLKRAQDLKINPDLNRRDTPQYDEAFKAIEK